MDIWAELSELARSNQETLERVQRNDAVWHMRQELDRQRQPPKPPPFVIERDVSGIPTAFDETSEQYQLLLEQKRQQHNY